MCYIFRRRVLSADTVPIIQTENSKNDVPSHLRLQVVVLRLIQMCSTMIVTMSAVVPSTTPRIYVLSDPFQLWPNPCLNRQVTLLALMGAWTLIPLLVQLVAVQFMAIERWMEEAASLCPVMLMTMPVLLWLLRRFRSELIVFRSTLIWTFAHGTDPCLILFFLDN